MYGPKLDMTEFWPERTCETQDTLNMMDNTCWPSIRTNSLPWVEKE